MKQKIWQGSIYLGHIILTALASAGIALLQNYLATHGHNVGPQINAGETAQIGTVLSGGKILMSQWKARILI